MTNTGQSLAQHDFRLINIGYLLTKLSGTYLVLCMYISFSNPRDLLFLRFNPTLALAHFLIPDHCYTGQKLADFGRPL